MAAVIAGLSGARWGTTDQNYLFVNSCQLKEGSQKNELPNGQGDIVQAVWHGRKNEFSISGKVRNVAALPASSLIGSEITIADGELGGTYYLDEITKNKQIGDWMEFEANATGYPAAQFTSTTTTT